ncbi:ROK family transcriptional regulator [Jiangella asiatica]|uniref:ROK family transcriptional regulator n=1 Tax=Jiangella asiatica TaxID=2530372 RepID=A0A4R5DBZ6_9ACTN|nr:ROK family transcriptional regulator [Jiangella asiatica]TDE11209.1 ROK family transcriptional regulator [Jiangella asiatica]
MSQASTMLRTMVDTGNGSLRSLRESNRERLLGLLQENGVLHRAELARRAGVSRTTVSTIVADLLDEGIVVEVGDDTDRYAAVDDVERKGSRPRTGLSLNPKAGAVIGLDFSADAVVGVVADLGHEVLAEESHDLGAELPWENRLDVGVDLAKTLLARADMPWSRVVGVGLGVPGPVDQRTGEVGASSRSLPWAGAHAASDLSRRLNVPVSMDNTAHLGALAEIAWGVAQGCRNVIYVKISSGLSAGLVVDGRVFGGAIGATGALGHMPVDLDGPVCPCGSRGCLELYAAVPALVAQLQGMSRDLTIGHILSMVDDGHRAARRVLADAAGTLGRVLAGVCNLLNPELVVIGGDLAAAGEHYLAPLESTLLDHALPIVADQLRVVPGQLGDRAGALGAVACVLREATPLRSTSTT